MISGAISPEIIRDHTGHRDDVVRVRVQGPVLLLGRRVLGKPALLARRHPPGSSRPAHPVPLLPPARPGPARPDPAVPGHDYGGSRVREYRESSLIMKLPRTRRPCP